MLHNLKIAGQNIYAENRYSEKRGIEKKIRA